MNYPLISEYINAIQSAEDNFDQLTHLRPIRDNEGNPIMTSGNFAVVFKMEDTQTGKLYAIKCFLKEQPERAEAYRLIAEELEYANSAYLTPIKYLEKELFVDTKATDDTEFPVLLMDWVEGVTLDKYIREHLYDEYALSMLAYRFSQLAMWLMPQPFAHGDLKPDNILVKPNGELVLIDYDGMYVPAMKGQKAHELGSPDFRHPLRSENDFDEHIDDFSLASILLSIKAIAIQPTLLEQYGATDRLLFSEKDYRDISQCQLLKELYSSPNAELNILMCLFNLALAKKNLTDVSYNLFDVSKPKQSETNTSRSNLSDNETIPINYSTYVTEQNFENAWIDEYGVQYSADKKRLLKAPKELTEYSIRQGTKVICNKAFEQVLLTKITIPNSVKRIGYKAFYECSGLTSITIPNSVTSIDEEAFWGCSGLTTINFNAENCTKMMSVMYDYMYEDICEEEYYSVFNSSNLKILNIGENVKTIPDYAFARCEGLTSVTIPDSVTNIGMYAFCGCKGLTAVTIPNSVTSIKNSAFWGCSGLTSITIPNSVTSIEYSAFSGCSALTSITIPNSVTSIEDSTFRGCSGLTSITIPNSVTSIGEWAFCDCSELTSVTIPNSVTNIEYSAFYDCRRLTEIKVATDNPNYKSIDGVLYNKDVTTLICCTKEKNGNFAIPNSVISIGYGAFHRCSGLTSITIPNSVTSIGVSAFRECKELSSITIPNSVTIIKGWAFFDCSGLTSITIPNSVTSIKDSAFRDCPRLTSITIPNSVTSIEDNAFRDCSGLTSITIPNSVISIGNRAFEGCSGLTTITIPNSVTNIGNMAFSFCEGLTSVSIPTSVESIKNWTFYGCTSLTSIIISNSVKIISSNAFRGCTSLTSIIIPNSVKIIGSCVFEGCTSLNSVVIPDSVEGIGESVFRDCTSLTSVVIPNSVEYIGDWTFVGCTNLTSVVIPNSVTSIGERAFGRSGLAEIKVATDNPNYKSIDGALYNKDTTKLIRCPNKKNGSFTIPNSVTSIGDLVFEGCSELTSVTIPNSVTNIGNWAFDRSGIAEIKVATDNPNYKSIDGILYNKDATTLIRYPNGKNGSFTIPNSVTSIEGLAFNDCPGLASIIIPNSVTRIGGYAFNICSKLTEIKVATDNPNYKSIDGVLYNKDVTTLICCPKGKNEIVSIPNSVTSIGDWAFYKCAGLTSITIPPSVTSIGELAFADCEKLISVTIPDSLRNIVDNAFAHCSNLQKIYKYVIDENGDLIYV